MIDKNSRSLLLREKGAIERAFSTSDGKEALGFLMDRVFSDLGRSKKDGYEYSYSEGQRSILVHIISCLNIPLNQFLLERKELETSSINSDLEIPSEESIFD